MGTWENGIFDYDHLKRSFLPTYKRYWDDASQVPYLFNPSTGIWISYDDLESIALKNDYIKREKLGGAMFWELSSDRNAELVSATFAALNNGQTFAPQSTPARTSTPGATAPVTVITSAASGSTTAFEPTPAAGTTTTKPSGGDAPLWDAHVAYRVGDRVKYDDKIYRCVQSHTSLPGWTPVVVAALWQLV